MAGVGENALSYQFLFIIGFKLLKQPGQIARTKPCVYLRNFFLQIIFIPLGKTAGYIDFINQTFLFSIYVPQNGVNRLLLGVVNKSAGVDNYHTGVIIRHLMTCINAVAAQLGEQHFAVHQVFGAAQCYDVNLNLFIAFGFHRAAKLKIKAGPYRSTPIFTPMRWILAVVLLLPACFDKPDCISQADNTLRIAFKRSVDNQPDTVIFYHIEAPGADSIFYLQQPVDLADTLKGTPAVVAVNPFADSTAFIFRFPLEEKTIKVRYQRNFRFIRENCFSEVRISNLQVYFTDFDSVRVAEPLLTQLKTVHIEVYR